MASVRSRPENPHDIRRTDEETLVGILGRVRGRSALEGDCGRDKAIRPFRLILAFVKPILVGRTVRRSYVRTVVHGREG